MVVFERVYDFPHCLHNILDCAFISFDSGPIQIFPFPGKRKVSLNAQVNITLDFLSIATLPFNIGHICHGFAFSGDCASFGLAHDPTVNCSSIQRQPYQSTRHFGVSVQCLLYSLITGSTGKSIVVVPLDSPVVFDVFCDV